MNSLPRLSEKLKDAFSDEFIKRVTYRTGFIKRKNIMTVDKFLALTVLYNDA